MANNGMLRWGILSTAEIARKNWKAILNSGNGVVTAVASRNLDRSQRFIAGCQAQAPFSSAPQAVGSYEALLASKEVDAVYIPLPTGLRKEWVIRAAEARKHMADGQFPPGSMGPKIAAALRYLDSGGKQVIITSLDRAFDALQGTAGTRITQ